MTERKEPKRKKLRAILLVLLWCISPRSVERWAIRRRRRLREVMRKAEKPGRNIAMTNAVIQVASNPPVKCKSVDVQFMPIPPNALACDIEQSLSLAMETMPRPPRGSWAWLQQQHAFRN